MSYQHLMSKIYSRNESLGEDENIKIEAVKRVLQALFQTLPLYTHRSSRKLNLELIKMLLKTSNKMTEMFLLQKFDKLASYEKQNKTIW